MLDPQQQIEAQRAVMLDQQRRIEELESALVDLARAARPAARQLQHPPKPLRKLITTYGTETWHALYCRLGGDLQAAVNRANKLLEDS